jgi:hypothetical protein
MRVDALLSEQFSRLRPGLLILDTVCLLAAFRGIGEEPTMPHHHACIDQQPSGQNDRVAFVIVTVNGPNVPAGCIYRVAFVIVVSHVTIHAVIIFVPAGQMTWVTFVIAYTLFARTVPS